jgi:hypothetical protein
MPKKIFENCALKSKDVYAKLEQPEASKDDQIGSRRLSDLAKFRTGLSVSPGAAGMILKKGSAVAEPRSVLFIERKNDRRRHANSGAKGFPKRLRQLKKSSA